MFAGLVLGTDRYHFLETDSDIFKTFFADIWSAADIQLATDTDICLPI